MSRRLCRSFLSKPIKSFTPFLSSSYCTTSHFSFNENTDDAADVEGNVSDATESVDVSKRPVYVDRPLENGLDYGIYKVTTPSFVHICIYRCSFFL